MGRHTLGTLAVLGVLLTGCGMQAGPAGEHGEGGDGKGEKEPVATVEVEDVARGDVIDWVVTHAVVESETQADLYPPATAQVLSVHADVGDRVERGDLLAVLEAVVQGAGAERASADVAKAERDYSKLVSLHTGGAVSDQELADAEHALATARSASREATFSYGKTRLVAPFSGVVASRDVREGGFAATSQPAFQIVDLTRLRVVASLPEREVSRVAPGQPALLVSAYDATRTATGHVSRVAPVIDAQTGTFRVTVALDPDQSALRPGQFVSTRLEVGRHADVVVVPKRSLTYEDGEPIVYTMVEPTDEEEEGTEAADRPAWVAAIASWFGSDEAAAEDSEGAEEEEDGPAFEARRHPLRLGLVDEDLAEVLEGVELGERVVVVGQSTLRDGTAIRPAGEEGEPDPAVAAPPEAPGGSEG